MNRLFWVPAIAALLLLGMPPAFPLAIAGGLGFVRGDRR
jgi:hypothetical protein